MKKFVAVAIVMTLILMGFVNLTDAEPNDLPWYFVGVFGDNRPLDTSAIEYPSVFYKIVYELNISHPFATMGTGDHTGRGTKAQIDKFLEVTKNLENLYVIRGNHDLNPTTTDYWHENVADDLYYVDIIPGWRFIFIDYYYTEVLWEDALKFLQDAASTERNKVLVVHRPIEPWLDHNMPEPVKSKLKNLIEEYSFKIVLQGHWHGYADTTINNVRYLVIGGGGAPLYEHPNGLKKYCYAFLILWPNGSYEVIPIDPLGGSISLYFTNNSVKIINTKLDVYGYPTIFPLRISINNKYIVLLAPYGVSYVNFTNNTIEVSKNISMWYVYETPETKPQETTTEGISFKEVIIIVIVAIVILVLLTSFQRPKRR